jgi:hypothetical protein
MTSSRDRQAWTRFVERRQRSERPSEPRRIRRSRRKPRPSPEELKTELDDLVSEAEQRRRGLSSQHNSTVVFGTS